MYGIGENAHVTICIDKFLNLISSHKQLNTQTLFYDEIANLTEIHSVVIMGDRDAENGLSKMKETLNELHLTNKLMQASTNIQNAENRIISRRLKRK